MMTDTIILRRAQADDSDSLLAWRNDPFVRRFSLDDSEIDPETHARWFNKSLRRDDRFLLIGEEDGKPIGVLRYDLAEDTATVSVYLVPGNQGKGYGAILLRAGSGWLKKHAPSVKRIEALILPENTASLKTFERAGYVPAGKRDDALIYHFNLTESKPMTQLKETEIRPQELMAEQARRYANDVARLMRHKADFVTVKCPACENADHKPAFEKYGMSFTTCAQCETIFANPRPLPEHLDEYYRESENYAYWNEFIFPASEESRRQKIFRPRVERVLEICKAHGVPTEVLVEVGAGFGLFCEEFAKENLFDRIVAIEPTPNLAETCRKRGLTVIEKPVEHISTEEIVGDKKAVNVIANFEVIEHLFSPKEFIRKCADLLDPGGILILSCPNAKGFDVVVLKEKSPAVDTEHVNLFNVDSLAGLMESCGLEVIERKTPGRLDAELVRNKALEGEFDLSGQPFLQQVLIDEWESTGQAFQDFLAENRLSSNMLLVARKK